MRKTGWVCAMAALGFISNPVLAQVIPAPAQPGRAPEQFQPQQPRPAIDLTLPSAPAAQQAPAGSAQVKFVLKSLTVRNATVYRPEELEALYKQYIGQQISIQDLYNIAALLTDKYRKDGYVLSQVQVPTQDIRDGHVTLEALEGFISKVVVQPAPGIEHLAQAKSFKRSAQKLEGMKPLTAPALERNLLLLNDLPGMRVKGVLKASPNTPNAAELYLLVTRDRVNGFVQADNRGSRFLGPLQYQAGMTINQLLDETDALGIRLATTYQTRESKFGELTYKRRLNSDGLNLQLRASTARTKPGSTLEPFEVEGKDNLYSAQLGYPLIRSKTKNLEVYGRLDARDVQTDILGTLISKDHIRAARLGGTFTNIDSYRGANLLNVEMSQGLSWLGASDRNDPVSRPAASPTFHKLNALASREQYLGQSAFSLYGALQGQYAANALYAAEEMGLGGEYFGSGYDPSEITGDSGAAVRLETRYTAQRPVRYVMQAQPYAFYDVGFVHNRDPGVGVNAEQSLASAGVGMRMNAEAGIAAALELAMPLTKSVSGLGNEKFPRLFFKLSKAF